jgi:glyoxylase-like metal-dependent hydrolase (beta-lactamase superfamily II)
MGTAAETTAMQGRGAHCTITYRVDRGFRFPEDVAPHKRAGIRNAGVPPSTAGPHGPPRRTATMNATLPARLDFPFPAPPRAGEAIAVAPGVLWLRMPLPFALDHINLWLLREDDGWTVIDCGLGLADTRALWERHFAATLEGRPVRRVVATHFHPDHVGNAAWLAARFGCPVAMTSAEFLTAHAVAAEHSGYSVAGIVDFFSRHGLAGDHAAGLSRRGNRYRLGAPELPATFERLLDGEAVHAGGTSWRIVEGHGHSPEHAALYCAERGILVSGDMLLPRITTNVSATQVEPDADPLSRFLDSLAAFDALPPDTLVLPSHGLPFRGIALRTAQLRTHHAARLGELGAAVAAAGAPCSAADLLPVLFPRELDLQQRFFAMGEAIAHLNHLWRTGRLDRRVAADGAIRFAPVH